MRIKKNLSRFGSWPLLESAVVQFVKDWPENFNIDQNEIAPLFSAAINPALMEIPENVGLRRRFSEIYAMHPDFVLALLSFIRKEWNREDHRFIAEKFLRTHPASGMQDGEIANEIKKLNNGLVVSTETVKKARAKGLKRDIKSL